MPKKGFMLLEVILSVLVIASGLLFIMRSYSASLKATAVASSLQKACLYLEDKLSELDFKGKIEEGVQDGSFEDDGNYSWHLDAQPLDDKKEVNTVFLTARYKSGSQYRNIGISTYLFNKGV